MVYVFLWSVCNSFLSPPCRSFSGTVPECDTLNPQQTPRATKRKDRDTIISDYEEVLRNPELGLMPRPPKWVGAIGCHSGPGGRATL